MSPSPRAGVAVGDDVALAELALTVGRAAASLLLDALDRERTEVGTKSTPTDMVTEMDRAVERVIVEGLHQARPGDAVLGEEGDLTTGTTGVLWCVDPIDGTTNYVYRLPGFAVSLAAIVDGETAVGVVIDPLHGDEFVARRGAGATRNGAPIAVSGAEDLSRALVATGFSYDAERRRRQAAVLQEVLPTVRDIRRSGAASVDLCWVACGRVDAYYEKGLAPWDYAAGELIAREAGALTGDLDGGPVSGEFALAASPALFEPMRSLLAAAGARHA